VQINLISILFFFFFFLFLCSTVLCLTFQLKEVLLALGAKKTVIKHQNQVMRFKKKKKGDINEQKTIENYGLPSPTILIFFSLYHSISLHDNFSNIPLSFICKNTEQIKGILYYIIITCNHKMKHKCLIT